MKIAILSDIHDNIWTLRSALNAMQDADVLICCGDLCSPFNVPLLAENFPNPIHFVYGNNDGDLFRITKNASRFSRFHIEGELFLTEMDGKKIVANHYDNIAMELTRSGVYDLVFFGHNHRYQVERFGKTLAINPGTLMGYSPLDMKEVPPTFVVYDTLTDQPTGFQVGSSLDYKSNMPVIPYSGSTH
jgi:putative phosphoesterase